MKFIYKNCKLMLLGFIMCSGIILAESEESLAQRNLAILKEVKDYIEKNSSLLNNDPIVLKYVKYFINNSSLSWKAFCDTCLRHITTVPEMCPVFNYRDVYPEYLINFLKEARNCRTIGCIRWQAGKYDPIILKLGFPQQTAKFIEERIKI